MEKEKTLEKKLVAEVKKRNGWAIKLLAGLVSGLPDRLCLLPGGRLFFAEIKGTGLKPTKIQKFVQDKIRDLGFRVEVVDSTEKLNQILKDYES